MPKLTIEQQKQIWEKLLSTKRLSELRTGVAKKEDLTDPRNAFQRDCDRITYSYPFRRLQDKTQVIPVPEIDFVHTRLTHTLEVTTVGRSLGMLLEKYLLENDILEIDRKGHISAIVAAACLAHDIGNPPFGHCGEDAISEYFNSYGVKKILTNNYREKGKKKTEYKIVDSGNESKIRDLRFFEGNAMGFRLLTKYDDIGLDLTAATLGAFTKYPRQSFITGEEDYKTRWNKERVSQKKYGFFQTEKEDFLLVANELGLKKLKKGKDICYCRHPLSFLMEAADDICYRIIDLEDGYRIGIINFEDASKPLVKLFTGRDKEDFDKEKYDKLPSDKQKFSFLRARVINYLIKQTFDIYIKYLPEILAGDFDKDLLSKLRKNDLDALKNVKDTIVEKVYKWHRVLSLEAAGFNVLGGLTEEFCSIVYKKKNHNLKKYKKFQQLLPDTFKHIETDEVYVNYIKVVQYISGMTDNYAISLFNKFKGHNIV